MMTKKEALTYFNHYILPAVKEKYESDGKVDSVARAENWNNFTDHLCKSGEITPLQYHNWSNPF